MKESVYLETSFISYLTARRSRDIVTVALQQITQDWWTKRHSIYNIYVSQRVIAEASCGNPEAVENRFKILKDIPILETTQQAESLAQCIMDSVDLPVKANEDALHIAIASVNQINYLLTWNCKHIANAVLIPKIHQVCMKEGFSCPVLCTPQELMEDYL